ncbi:MAG: hypothetical protein ABIP21_00225 [Acidimicrobiia bacterium]
MADETDTATGGETDTDTGDTSDELGAAGVQALEAFKARARTAEKEAKAAKAELDRIRSSNLNETERAIEAAKREAADAATAVVEQKYQTRLDSADVRIAADGFADPADAVLFLDLEDLPRDESGALNEKALKNALRKVLEAKPHLAKSGVRGSADQGARGAGPAAEDDMNNRIRQAAGR